MDLRKRLEKLEVSLTKREDEKERAERSILRIESEKRKIKKLLENPNLIREKRTKTKKVEPDEKPEKVFSEKTHNLPLKEQEKKTFKSALGSALFGEGGEDE